MTLSLRHVILRKSEEMPVTEPKASRSTLNLRIKPELRSLIDRAAELQGKNRTDFVLSAARQAAEDTLLSRTVIAMEPKVYQEFVARLDAPPNPNPRLLRTLETAAPWEM